MVDPLNPMWPVRSMRCRSGPGIRALSPKRSARARYRVSSALIPPVTSTKMAPSSSATRIRLFSERAVGPVQVARNRLSTLLFPHKAEFVEGPVRKVLDPLAKSLAALHEPCSFLKMFY